MDLLKKIGEGAFGEVHLGRFSATSSFRVYVAVKLVSFAFFLHHLLTVRSLRRLFILCSSGGLRVKSGRKNHS